MGKKIYVIFILLFSSCANLEEEKSKLFTQPESKDLVTSFDVDHEKAKTYKEEIVDESKIELKKEKRKISKLKELKESAKIKTVKKIEQVKEPVPGEFLYPADYPEHLKEYDRLGKNNWSKFKPIFLQNEKSIMAISYLGVTAGYITITSKDIVKINDKIAYHFFARFKSADAYRYFYWLDDSLESFVEKSTFLPIKYTLLQREKKQNVDDLQLFDFNKLKTYTWYKRIKEGSNKNEHLEKYVPRYAQDSFSALQFVRGLPLNIGDKYDFSVITRGDAWLLKVEVVDEEIINIQGQDIKAIKIKAETHFPGVLQKSGDINFWYSKDELRKLLKFKAKVKLGSINGELVEYSPGTKQH